MISFPGSFFSLGSCTTLPERLHGDSGLLGNPCGFCDSLYRGSERTLGRRS